MAACRQFESTDLGECIIAKSLADLFYVGRLRFSPAWGRTR